MVSEMAGIQLGPKQHSMVENRLKTRLLKLNLTSFQDYLGHLKRNKENESQALLSLMTTHHTFFFREFGHFEYMLNSVLPRAIECARKREDYTIRIWSAACSRGQEVYSLAMFMSYHLKYMAPEIKYEIWGSDVDPESVERAKQGVYKAEEIKQSPAMYVDGNWVKGQGSASGFVKAKDHLKANCKFQTVNLLNPSVFLKDRVFDVIFCRNVFIYFNQDQIKSITSQFLKHLDKDGFLFLGVSETLQGLGLDVNLNGSSVYQHKNADTKKPQFISAPTPSIPKVMNVLCIDDSKTILSLLKKILVPDQGFKVTAIAENGRLGLEELQKGKFDVITLDLHMPELDGLGFLQKMGPAAPPVLIVSSINRDDMTIAQKAIKGGAADYVEKPSLENLTQAGNEIRSKLKTIWQMNHQKQDSLSTEKSGPVRGSTTLATVPFKSSGYQITPERKKVLIVDDSQTIRQLLQKIISTDPGLEVVAVAEKPSQVEGLIRQHKPHVITMDINMPEMSGVELVRKLHPIYKIPIIMISSLSKDDGPQVMQAMEYGAIDYIQKPDASKLVDSSRTICERIKTAAHSKFVNVSLSKRRVTMRGDYAGDTLVVIGSSTGGTEALRVILESLPAEIPPILIVQHIPAVFSEAFAQRMNSLVSFEVREAKNGDEIKKNRVLIAPGGQQLGIKKLGQQLVATVTDDPPVNRHKPSVDYLFQSVSRLHFKNVISVILTGMGADGARQMKSLRDLGARTIAQDEETSVVWGMPKEAVRLQAAEFVLPLQSIAEKIIQLSVASTSVSQKKAS